VIRLRNRCVCSPGLRGRHELGATSRSTVPAFSGQFFESYSNSAVFKVCSGSREAPAAAQAPDQREIAIVCWQVLIAYLLAY